MENRTMTNDKGTGDNPFTQGEPYAPFGSAFYMITNFGKSGLGTPITFDTNAALAVLMQGATLYDFYLNPL